MRSAANWKPRRLQEVVKLAIAIARRVTKRQGLLDPQVLTANLEEAMKLVVACSRMCASPFIPRSERRSTTRCPRLSCSGRASKHVELIEDADACAGRLPRLHAAGQIDADLDVQLDRIVADLLPDHRDGGGVSLLAGTTRCRR